MFGMVGFLFCDEVFYDEDVFKGLLVNVVDVFDVCVLVLELVDDFMLESI